MILEEMILSNPVAASALTIILIIAVAYLRKVGPRRAIAAETVRNIAQPLAERRLSDDIRKLTRRKALPHHSGEYVTSVDVGLLTLAKGLWSFGFRWNPISTKKYRVIDGSKQYAVLSVALRESLVADAQLHAYVFPAPQSSGYDVYAHLEANVTDPADHSGGGEQIAGDPDGALLNALSEADIGHERRPHSPPA